MDLILFKLLLLHTAIVINHLIYLHNSIAANPIEKSIIINKIPFHPYYLIKDLLGVIIIF